jgi:hypothetical protein
MFVRRPLRLVFATAFGLLGCNALIDVKDIYLDPNASTPEGGSAEGSVGPEGGAGEGGNDGGACGADLQTDAKNCGRCGHDCVGGACNAGKCEAVVLLGGLGNPSGIALGPNDVYVTTLGTEAVLSVSKNGGTASTLATGVTRARGVAVQGSTLYWGNGDFKFDDAGYKGGVWECTLPTCADQKLVAAGDWAASPTARGGFLYFAETNGTGTISRVTVPGGKISVLTPVTQPFGLAVDDAYAYFTSAQNPALARARVDGGGPVNGEGIGSDSDNSSVGFAAVDDERVYWVYTTKAGAGHVTSVAKAAPAAGAVDYGTPADNLLPLGVVVDAESVYWATVGNGTGDQPAGDGKIFTCKKQGCGGAPPVLLASGNQSAGPMAVDDKAIYWVEFGTLNQTSGRLRKVAKP